MSTLQKRPKWLNSGAIVRTKLKKIAHKFLVKTRKQAPREDDWKVVDKTLLVRQFGLGVESGVKYRLCAFDLDHTVITTNSGRVGAKDARDWKFFLPNVPKRLTEELTKPLEDGLKSIFVIFSNQNPLGKDEVERVKFQGKIENILSKLGVEVHCPVITCFALFKDIYRKPCPGMWTYVKERLIEERGATISIEESFFVGDAAGRLAGWRQGKSADWSGVDRKFALNVGLKFFTPEEYFLNEPHCPKFDVGRDPKQILSADATFSIECSSSQEVIITVGSPASGKSTLFKRHFASYNYAYVNRDTLGTTAKCKAAVRAAIDAGKSVYIDNTHANRDSRRDLIEMAKERGLRIRCLQFIVDDWLSKHLDYFRAVTQKIDPLPNVAFNVFHSRYQPPVIEEGYDEIVQVRFVPQFENDDQKQLFCQYLI